MIMMIMISTYLIHQSNLRSPFAFQSKICNRASAIPRSS
jgi:hypothetical protein